MLDRMAPRVPPEPVDPSPGPDELPELAAAVLDLVDLVPPGRVVTYGDLARALGCGPRQVGAVPRHHRAEGTPLRRGGTAVDLRLARWDGVLEDPNPDR